MRQPRGERYLGVSLNQTGVRAVLLRAEGIEKRIEAVNYQPFPDGAIGDNAEFLNEPALARALVRAIGEWAETATSAVVVVPDEWGVVQILNYPDANQDTLFHRAYETVNSYATFADSQPALDTSVLERFDSPDGTQARVFAGAVRRKLADGIANLCAAAGLNDFYITFASTALGAAVEEELPAETNFGLILLEREATALQVFGSGTLHFHYGAAHGWLEPGAETGIFSSELQEEPVRADLLAELNSWLGFYHDRFPESELDVLFCITDHEDPNAVQTVLWNQLDVPNVRLLDPLGSFTLADGLQVEQRLSVAIAAGGVRALLPRRGLVPVVMPFQQRRKEPVKVPNLIVWPLIGAVVVALVLGGAKVAIDMRSAKFQDQVITAKGQLMEVEVQVELLQGHRKPVAIHDPVHPEAGRSCDRQEEISLVADPGRDVQPLARRGEGCDTHYGQGCQACSRGRLQHLYVIPQSMAALQRSPLFAKSRAGFNGSSNQTTRIQQRVQIVDYAKDHRAKGSKANRRRG